MLKIYCSQCGNPTTYSSLKPKFCSSCGTSFDIVDIKRNNILENITKAEIKQNDIHALIEVEGEEKEVNYVPEISNLDCEISVQKSRGIKIKDLAGTSDNLEKSQENKSLLKIKKMSKSEKRKAALSILKEGASIRSKK